MDKIFGWVLHTPLCSIQFEKNHRETQDELYGGSSRAPIMGVFSVSRYRLLAVNYFHKKAPSQMFNWVTQTTRSRCIEKEVVKQCSE